MASSPTPIGSILPIGPVAQSTSDSKQTPPFTKDAASRELRAAILKRRKESRVWFSKAAEKDKEQGTQLGTLGFLPWEIRQQIIGMFRPKNSHRNRRGAVLDRCDSAPYILGKDVFSGSWEWSYPGLGDVINFRGASASLGIEVEYNFYTLTDFRFVFPFELEHFLSCLTTRQQSLLRSLTLHISRHSHARDSIEMNEAWMTISSRLPSRLTSVSIEFELSDPSDPTGTVSSVGHNEARNGSGFPELLGTRIKSCWAPEAKVSLDREETGNW